MCNNKEDFFAMKTVILSLGSNLGDRHCYLEHAKNELMLFISDVKASRVIETLPMYVTNQPSFLNQVVIGQTTLDPFDLLAKTKHLQKKIGRVKTIEKGPREIDIDILYMGTLVVNTPELIIPHPGIFERLFVLEPLCELTPHWICPLSGKSAREMLGALLGKNEEGGV